MNDIDRIKELAGMLTESEVVEIHRTESTQQTNERHPAPREATNTIMTMIDEGVLDARQVADACLMWMSDAEVSEMAHQNEFPMSDEDIYGDDTE